jgi:hypothetical protein
MSMGNDIEKRLWVAADQLWANSSLKVNLSKTLNPQGMQRYVIQFL